MNGDPGQKPVQSYSGLAHSREFLEAVAAVTRAQALDQAANFERRPRRPFILGTLAVVALLLVLAREHGWGLGVEHDAVPPIFHGTWATTAARHADRGFVITGDSLRLLTGPNHGITYPIVGVSRHTDRDQTLFTLHYRDGDQNLTLRLGLEPDTTLRIANLPTVAWTRKNQ